VVFGEGDCDGEAVGNALEGIEGCCRGVIIEEEEDGGDIGDGDGVNNGTDGDAEAKDTNEGTETNDEAGEILRLSKQKQTRQKLQERSEAFLTLLHSSNSMYTLMSLLGTVPLPPDDGDNDTTTQSFAPSNERQKILAKVLHTLTSILTSRRAREREIKALLRNSFVSVLERLVLLLFHYLQLCQTPITTTSTTTTTTHNDNLTLLGGILRLIGAACRNSERNKVAFVRTLKNKNQKEQQRKGDVDATSIYGRSTVTLLVKTLCMARDSYSNNTSNIQTNDANLALMTEVCKLVSILCRYDDFQPEGGGGGGDLGVESSQGVNVSSSHDHVLEFSREGIVPVLQNITLLSLSQEGKEEETGNGGETEEQVVALAGAALMATRVLAVNDETVQAMVAVGTLKTIKLALDLGVTEVLETTTTTDDTKDNDDADKKKQKLKMERRLLTAGAIGLIRNLSGNDEIKTTLCLGSNTNETASSSDMTSTSVLPSILQGMKLYQTDASIQEHGCGALAAMALRRPANAMRIVQQDGPRALLTGMRQFPGNVLVQRQGALAIRNIVSRLVANPSLLADAGGDGGGGEGVDAPLESNSDGNGGNTTNSATINVRDVFLDLGAEVILRQITGRHQGSVDEAYAALRDLDCQVSMVKFDSETHKATSRVAMFGDVKPKFRAVYEESSALDDGKGGMEERISEHADGGAGTS